MKRKKAPSSRVTPPAPPVGGSGADAGDGVPGTMGRRAPKRRVVRKRTLRFKCPYCGAFLSDELKTLCPACGKQMRIPGPLRSARRRRRPAVPRDQIDRMRESGMVNQLPPFLLRRNTPLLFVFVLVLLFLGFGLVSELTVRYEDPAVVAEMIDTAEAELRVLRIALERFREDVGRYPTTEENLPILRHGSSRVPEMRYRYITSIRPDPWDQYYIYRNVDGEVVLFSSGPDRTPGTPDDIYPPEGWEAGVPRNWPAHTRVRRAEDLVVDVLRGLPARRENVPEPDFTD